MWKVFRYYIVPHFINKYIFRLTANEKAYAFVEYCSRVIRNPETQPKTYQEQMFEEKFSENRVTDACAYLCALVPYCDINWKELKKIARNV